MGTVVVLFGPKGVGKSWVAETIERELGVPYLDADAVILPLLAVGESPDPVNGWLQWVEAAVLTALEAHEILSVEATGAFDSDFLLVDHLKAQSHRVVRIWLYAPEEVTLERRRTRSSLKVPTNESDARAIYLVATERSLTEHWELSLDMTGSQSAAEVVASIRAVIS